ncbi:hypothetical protein SK3146_04801 [Paenibacillus konkukensis]|uniref:Uncharacterized protein n=1 Tax=Paenibacillus konkukensis TaxID=2020716 RepID=A0ABY4RSV8_9BACL|nr:hypothetical protein SK3146_04801 [Paenibacillus konkukensis]
MKKADRPQVMPGFLHIMLEKGRFFYEKMFFIKNENDDIVYMVIFYK